MEYVVEAWRAHLNAKGEQLDISYGEDLEDASGELPAIREVLASMRVGCVRACANSIKRQARAPATSAALSRCSARSPWPTSRWATKT